MIWKNVWKASRTFGCQREQKIYFSVNKILLQKKKHNTYEI
jgi:hypothetical protein